MPAGARPCEFLGLWPRDPPRPGGHYFLSNNALEGMLILTPLSFCDKLYPIPCSLAVVFMVKKRM